MTATRCAACGEPGHRYGRNEGMDRFDPMACINGLRGRINELCKARVGGGEVKVPYDPLTVTADMPEGNWGIFFYDKDEAYHRRIGVGLSNEGYPPPASTQDWYGLTERIIADFKTLARFDYDVASAESEEGL